MGSGFFSSPSQHLHELFSGTPMTHLEPWKTSDFMGGNIPGVNPGTAGPYSGVAPTLAGANAGYGGAVQPGANSYAAAAPLNPYARAAAWK